MSIDSAPDIDLSEHLVAHSASDPVAPDPSSRSGRRRSSEPQPSDSRATRRRRAGRDDTTWLVSTSLLVLAGLLLGFVAEVVVVSQVQQARNQAVLLSDFRSDLANAVATTGQIDADGNLVSPGTAVAIIEIPVLGVKQVVVEGTTSGNTMNGPGHRRDTPLPGEPGTSVIFGRQASFGGPFGGLRTLVPGDEIVVTTGLGVQKFAVTDLRRSGDPLPPALAAGAGRLTLVTADGTPYIPSDVLRVDSKLVSPVQPAGPKVIGTSSLAPAEAAMQGDPTAWVGIVLWAQALLLVALGITWARSRWGLWQSWVIGVPLLGFVGLALGGQIVTLLPNLM